MYVTDIRDFRVKANEYFSARGRSRSFSSEERTAKLILYGTEVFYLGMPTSEREGLSFQYEVSSTTRTHEFFGARLGSVQNAKPEVERAFEIIDNFARLHLPDKYLEAWAVSAARDS